jgi:uncharacterized phage-associated protein
MEKTSKKQKLELFPKITEVADYFLHKYKCNSKKMNVLVLQKLSYLAQCHYLAHYDKPLFQEDFKHYQKGPCQEDLMNYVKQMRRPDWEQLKNCGKKAEASEILLDKFEYRYPVFEDEHVEIMDFVYESTKNMTTFEMMEKIHETISKCNPWRSTKLFETMTKQSLQQYYSQDFYINARKDWMKYRTSVYYINSKMRYEISSYSSLQIDEWILASKDIDFGDRLVFVWADQSIQNAHLSSILFPIELEERHDPPTLLFWNPCIIKRLCLCAEWGNPIAMYLLYTCIEFHLNGRKTQEEQRLLDISVRLLENAITLYQKQKQAQMDAKYPYFEMGQLSTLLCISNGLDFYQSGMKYDIRCKARALEEVVELKKLTNEYPPVNFELAFLDPENTEKYLEEIRDRCPYANFELSSLQKTVSNRVKFLEIACNERVYSACQPLCDLLFANGKFDEGVNVLKKIGEYGDLFAYTKLGDLFESRDVNIADEFYKKNPLLERYKSYVIRGEKKNVIDELNNTILRRLLDVITGGEE